MQLSHSASDRAYNEKLSAIKSYNYHTERFLKRFKRMEAICFWLQDQEVIKIQKRICQEEYDFNKSDKIHYALERCGGGVIE